MMCVTAWVVFSIVLACTSEVQFNAHWAITTKGAPSPTAAAAAAVPASAAAATSLAEMAVASAHDEADAHADDQASVVQCCSLWRGGVGTPGALLAAPCRPLHCPSLAKRRPTRGEDAQQGTARSGEQGAGRAHTVGPQTATVYDAALTIGVGVGLVVGVRGVLTSRRATRRT